MAYYARPEEILKRFQELFEAHKEELGLFYVALQEETLIPQYPALGIVAGPVVRQIHARQQFEVDFSFLFWIYHAKLDVGHARRSIEDMELATGVTRFLHRPANRRLILNNENKLVFSHVTAEVPGLVYPETGPAIIVTRLTWNGKSVVNYDDA